MIKQANVGVGIKDGENSHAAGSSDLAIKRVGDLPGLMFHHGKQNWERNTKMAHLISGMKMTVVLALLFYDVIYNDFTAKALFTGTHHNTPHQRSELCCYLGFNTCMFFLFRTNAIGI